MAIHAIASDARTPEQIWEDPTQGEFDTVAMAVENYVACGVFDAEDDGQYQWGCEAITITA